MTITPIPIDFNQRVFYTDIYVLNTRASTEDSDCNDQSSTGFGIKGF